MRRPAGLVAIAVLAASLFGFGATTAEAKAPEAPITSIDAPFVGQTFTISGSLDATGKRKVVLQTRRADKTWRRADTARTVKSGSYLFTTSIAGRGQTFRVVAPATDDRPEVTTPALTVKTETDAVDFFLSRDQHNLIALGAASPARPGRAFSLQVRTGKKWEPVGPQFAESAEGKLSLTVPLAGAKTYRLVGEPVEGSAGVVSHTVDFDPGPATLGRHVIFATTDSGRMPTKPGRDYTGSLTIDDSGPMALDSLAVSPGSAARDPKQPYVLTFDDVQSPAGLPKGRSFVLLPNYQDRSLVRTAVGVGLAGQLDGFGWTPHQVFTELFVNGRYRGSYQLAESVKIDPGERDAPRINVNPASGVVVEIDPHFAAEGVPGFVGARGISYAIKPADQGAALTSEKISAARDRIDELEQAVYGPDVRDPQKGWQGHLDVRAAVDFYLQAEYVKDWDSDFYRNISFSIDNVFDPSAKIVMHPVVELERSAGAKSTGTSSVASPKGWWLTGDGGGHLNSSDNVHAQHWFVRIARDPAFTELVKQRWSARKAAFASVGEAGVDAATNDLGEPVAANDRGRWGAVDSPKRYAAHADSYAGEVAFLKKWYKDRYSWMNSQLG